MTVLLSVQDKGPGISPTDQEKLFNNFSLTRPDELQKGSGPGLGLTISRQIVELHGGRIGVKPIEGGGSQFFFAIPFQVYTLYIQYYCYYYQYYHRYCYYYCYHYYYHN